MCSEDSLESFIRSLKIKGTDVETMKKFIKQENCKDFVLFLGKHGLDVELLWDAIYNMSIKENGKRITFIIKLLRNPSDLKMMTRGIADIL